MADIKTNLRELSVAVGIHYAHIKKHPQEVIDSTPNFFYDLCSHIVSNDISNAQNILSLNTFNAEHRSIIYNGLKLGTAIVELKLSSDFSSLLWLGGDTQKNDPIDLSVGGVGFSLKEESFILENMGLYKYLNLLTGSDFKRGLHVFKIFAPQEYENWFEHTWTQLLNFPNKEWNYNNGRYTSKICITAQGIAFYHKSKLISTLPNAPIDINTFENLTTSLSREKVFAKWISEQLSNDETYIRLKNICSVNAGKRLCAYVKEHFNPIGLTRLLQIYPKGYYYAKSTASELSIFHVPEAAKFDKEIKVSSVNYSVPSSQLNLITTLVNTISGNTLVFRNECRFSHGQFNGTPEAKMYYDSGNDLSVIYNRIYPFN